jgi:hypothetical protein
MALGLDAFIEEELRREKLGLPSIGDEEQMTAATTTTTTADGEKYEEEDFMLTDAEAEAAMERIMGEHAAAFTQLPRERALNAKTQEGHMVPFRREDVYVQGVEDATASKYKHQRTRRRHLLTQTLMEVLSIELLKGWKTALKVSELRFKLLKIVMGRKEEYIKVHWTVVIPPGFDNQYEQSVPDILQDRLVSIVGAVRYQLGERAPSKYVPSLTFKYMRPDITVSRSKETNRLDIKPFTETSPLFQKAWARRVRRVSGNSRKMAKVRTREKNLRVHAAQLKTAQRKREAQAKKSGWARVKED